MRSKLFRLGAENFCRLLKTFVVENTGFSTQRRSARNFMNIYASSVIKIREKNFTKMKIVIPTDEFIIFLFIKLSHFCENFFQQKMFARARKTFSLVCGFSSRRRKEIFIKKFYALSLPVAKTIFSLFVCYYSCYQSKKLLTAKRIVLPDV